MLRTHEGRSRGNDSTNRAVCGYALDDELLAITLEHSSLAFMQAHKDRFDDAMLRARSEEEVLPPGSDSAKVRAGQVGEFEFSEEVKRRFESLGLSICCLRWVPSL